MKNKAESITIVDLRLYYKAITLTTVWDLHQKKAHRSTEQNRELRNKPMFIWSINPYIQWGNIYNRARIYNGENRISSINGAGKTGQLNVKNETGLLSNTIHKNKFKMD